MFDLAIVNGRIVNEERIYAADVYIRSGKIQMIALGGTEIEEPVRRTIDARDKLLFPGAVDAHMHIGEYEADFEDMQTSTRAAAAGGVTTCIDMPLNLYSPSVLNADILKKKQTLLNKESYVDYCLWGALVPQNLEELAGLHEAGAIAYKCFLSGGGNDFKAPDLEEVRQAMMTLKTFDGLAGFHCEDYGMIVRGRKNVLENRLDGRQAFLDSRPLLAEMVATQNILLLAQETGAKVHICHVSHPKVAALIEKAKSDGVDVTAETCAHYLTFSETDYLEKGCLFGCAPPMRGEAAKEGLWHYLERGVLDWVASDHSPGMAANRDDTNQPTYASGFGISGVQTLFQTVYDQGVNRRGYAPTLLARCLAANPARRFGIYGTKGAIEVGFDADIVIFDPEKAWTIDAQALFYKQKITAFDGLRGKGCPCEVIIRGATIVKEGSIQVEKGFGRRVNVGEVSR